MRQSMGLRIFLSMSLDNMFYRSDSEYESYELGDYYKDQNGQNYTVQCKNIVVFSFRYKDTFSSQQKEQVMKQLTVENNTAQIYHEIFKYIQELKSHNKIAYALQPIKDYLLKEMKLKNKYGRSIYGIKSPQKNLDAFLQENYVKEKIQKIKMESPINTFNHYKTQINQGAKVLGKGGFGEVYEVMDSEEKEETCALKIQRLISLESFTAQFQEIFFHLSFPEFAPLLPLKDMFIEYKNFSLKPFLLAILMKKTDMDVEHFCRNLVKENKYIEFEQFFPIFRDSILGMTFMHMNQIVHRDFKPDNIMKLIQKEEEADRYVVADFGVGINLKNQKKQKKNGDFYQKDKWKLAGTIPYLDPILRNQIGKLDQEEEEVEWDEIDLHKADIFSLGVTFFQIITRNDPIWREIGKKESKQKDCYDRIHKQSENALKNFPLPIKQCILHMISFRSENRIPTFALYNNLLDIIRVFEGEIKLSVELNLNIKQDLFEIKRRNDLFPENRADQQSRYQKIKKQTLLDQTFYTGHLQLDYVDSANDQTNKLAGLEEGTIILVKPNFNPGIFKNLVENDQYQIELLGNEITVKSKDIILVKLPQYKTSQFVQYFDEEEGQWILCELSDINEEAKEYTLKYDDQIQAVLPFNSLKIRPLQLNFGQTKTFFPSASEYSQIIPDEYDLMKEVMINFNQSFELDIYLNNSQWEAKREEYRQLQFSQQAKYRLNFHINREMEKFRENYLETFKNEGLIISQLEIAGQDMNYFFQDSQYNMDLSTLHNFYLSSCNFVNIKNLEYFLATTKQLRRIEFYALKFDQEFRGPLSTRFMELIQSQPLKEFHMDIYSVENSNVSMSLETVTDIFRALESKNLDEFYLGVYPDLKDNSAEEQLNLEKLLNEAFERFLQSQKNLHYLRLYFGFHKDQKVKYKVLNYLPTYIDERKEYLVKFKKFYIDIYGMDYAHTKKLHDQIEESVGENNERWEIKLDKDYLGRDGLIIKAVPEEP